MYTHQGLSPFQVWSFWGKAFLSYRYRYPLHSVWETDMTFDLNLSPTDLNIIINRDHLLIKDYLPTKFEASGAKCSWVIRCTRCGRLTLTLTLTFDLQYSSRDFNNDHLLIKDYLPTKFEDSGAKPSWVIRWTDRNTSSIHMPLLLCFAIWPKRNQITIYIIMSYFGCHIPAEPDLLWLSSAVSLSHSQRRSLPFWSETVTSNPDFGK